MENQSHVVAIREALVNLLMHTDYFSQMKPRIRVFTNRIEFFNPGALPKDIETILKEDLTLPRNPVIAKIFRVINLAQNAGYGFEKMINGWKSYYQTGPDINSGQDYFRISFSTDKAYPENGINTNSKTGGKTGGKTKNTNDESKVYEINGTNTEKQLLLKRTPKELEILGHIIRNPQITYKDLAELLGVDSTTSVQKRIEKLKEKGIIARVGTFGGYWEILIDL